MRRKRPFRKDILPLVHELGPEDGIDPRYLVNKPGSGQPGRKALQLCSAVGKTIQHALCWELHDDVLANVHVTGVIPAPSTARLLVTVGAVGSEVQPEVVLTRLRLSAGRLRGLIAATVARRRVPELIFRLEL